MFAARDGCPADYLTVSKSCVHRSLTAQYPAGQLRELVDAYEHGVAPPALAALKGENTVQPSEVAQAPVNPYLMQGSSDGDASFPSLPPPSRSEVTLADSVNLYRIYGASAEQLRSHLSEVGPLLADGSRSDAYTHYVLRWRFGWQNDVAGCRAYPVVVHIDIKQTLPTWTPTSKVEQGLEARWLRYATALKRHEDIHRRYGIDKAHKLRQQIEALPPADSCEEASRRANELGYKLLKELTAENEAFDKIEGRGAPHSPQL